MMAQFFSGLLTSSIICKFPWVGHMHQLYCFTFARRTNGYVYSILFHHSHLHGYFHEGLVQWKLHLFEHLINPLMTIPVTHIAIRSYFSKPTRQHMLLKTT